MKRIYIEFSACNRRGLDASRIANYFILNGCKIVGEPELSDLIVYFTCSYKKSKEDECINLIQKLNTYKSELIVLGCLPAIAEDRLKTVFKGRYLATKDINKIDEFFTEFKIKYDNTPDSYLQYDKISNKIKKRHKPFWIFKKPDINSLLSNEIFNKKRNIINLNKNKIVNLRIASGCIGKCSYCVIPMAIGTLVSKPIKSCIQDYSVLLNKGFRKFHIIAPDTGTYGFDIGSSLPTLLEALSEIDKDYSAKWYIQTLSPQYAIKHKNFLIRYIQKGKISLLKSDIQSGNERILNLMNRYSNIKKFISTFKEFKMANKNLLTWTQIMVGFPSEKESEFQDSIKLMDTLNLTAYQVFPYCGMEGSQSSKIKEAVPERIINNRFNYIKEYYENKGYWSEYDNHRLTLIRRDRKDIWRNWESR